MLTDRSITFGAFNDRGVRHELVAVKPADEPWQLIDIATTTRGERVTTEVERFAAYETSDAVRAVADDILRHHPD